MGITDWLASSEGHAWIKAHHRPISTSLFTIKDDFEESLGNPFYDNLGLWSEVTYTWKAAEDITPLTCDGGWSWEGWDI